MYNNYHSNLPVFYFPILYFLVTESSHFYNFKREFKDDLVELPYFGDDKTKCKLVTCQRSNNPTVTVPGAEFSFLAFSTFTWIISEF